LTPGARLNQIIGEKGSSKQNLPDGRSINFEKVMMEGSVSLPEQHLQNKWQVLFLFGAIDELMEQSSNLLCGSRRAS